LGQAEKETEVTSVKRTGRLKWIVSGLLLALAAFIVMSLPRGYSDDLSPIGKGKPAVVLIRDKNAVQSFDLIDVMNSIRDEYTGKVEFLLTDFDTRQGQVFAETHHATRATLVLLDANGNLAKVLHAPQTAGSLRQEIGTLFGGKP